MRVLRETAEQEQFDRLVLPFAKLYRFFVVPFLPIVSTTVLGFTDWNLVSGLGGIQFNGAENFIQIAHDQTFWTAFVNTFIFVLGSVPITIVLAILLAVILNDKVFLRVESG